MDRCPNCGSTVRVGAKFCTTCGFRLPVAATAPESAAPVRSPFDITTSTASVWPSFSATGSDTAAEANEPAAAEPVAATAEREAAPIEQGEQAAPFSGWPAYGSGYGARTNWPGVAPSTASSFEAVADANASAQKGEAIDFEALYAPEKPAEAEPAGNQPAANVIDLHALARAEEPEFDALASYFDRGAKRIEEAGDAAAAGEAVDAVANSASSDVASGDQPTASGESGTGESVDRYIERMNAPAAQESVADYLARLGEGQAAALVDSPDASETGVDDPKAIAEAPATSGESVVDTSQSAGEVDILARYAHDDELQPRSPADESAVGAEPAASDDGAFENIFDRIFESDEATGEQPTPAEPTSASESGHETAAIPEAAAEIAAEEPVPVQEETPSAAAGETEQAVEPAVPTGPEEPEVAAASAGESVQPSEPDQSEPAELPSEPTADEPVIAAETEAEAHSSVPEATADAATEQDAASRAAALVAELQALLPRLTAGPKAPTIDLAAIADRLAEQRGGTLESAELQALRATIATAQARPRDVDVMLDLVAKSANIADLLAAHDRFARAIDEAVSALRGETPPAPQPRW